MVGKVHQPTHRQMVCAWLEKHEPASCHVQRNQPRVAWCGGIWQAGRRNQQNVFQTNRKWWGREAWWWQKEGEETRTRNSSTNQTKLPNVHPNKQRKVVVVVGEGRKAGASSSHKATRVTKGKKKPNKLKWCMQKEGKKKKEERTALNNLQCARARTPIWLVNGRCCSRAAMVIEHAWLSGGCRWHIRHAVVYLMPPGNA